MFFLCLNVQSHAICNSYIIISHNMHNSCTTLLTPCLLTSDYRTMTNQIHPNPTMSLKSFPNTFPKVSHACKNISKKNWAVISRGLLLPPLNETLLHTHTGFCTNLDEYLRRISIPSKFKPFGELVHVYSQSDSTYEVYKVSVLKCNSDLTLWNNFDQFINQSVSQSCY